MSVPSNNNNNNNYEERGFCDDEIAGCLNEIKESGIENFWENNFLRLVEDSKQESPKLAFGNNLKRLFQQDETISREISFDSIVDEELGLSEEQSKAIRLGKLTRIKNHFTDFISKIVPHKTLKDSDGGGIRYYKREKFENWGHTVANVPYATFVPRSKKGVQDIVKYAISKNKRVRASGYRHSWSSVYSEDDQILISMLPLKIATQLPAQHPPIDKFNQLEGIEIIGTIEENSVRKGLCRIGPATTNEHFREWCLSEQGGNFTWTVPFNVIMVEITWGGSNAPICHGAGIKSTTLSDLVHEIEFVNARGELQIVNDPQLIRAASGCFGLLGIVTSLTIKLDPMTYAKMTPQKKRVALTIPPPANFPIPREIDMSGITQQQLNEARNQFIHNCINDHYSEWFWFPYRSNCWINCWNNDGRKEDSKAPFPTKFSVKIQEAQEYLAQLMNQSVFKVLGGRNQANLLAIGAMAALPTESVTVPLIEALHFRRGIQNMRVLDMEMEIPIPASKQDPNQPDWTICQIAWWQVIKRVYERKDTPMRIALEMRITGASNVTMAPQSGNRFGTCSIEILTTPNTEKEEWHDFKQQVINDWATLTDANGVPLNIRSHWAKEWEGLSMRNQPIIDYFKGPAAYGNKIEEFKRQLDAIARAGGYSLNDIQTRFSNNTLDNLFEQVWKRS
eukprot:TRINITY_DN48_c0_g2_i2.p1 TRINITY_DN48_c0_g2~~TRINITY_DN48_c0_g2_i2.p1  ORF type:complete len:678 (+),score=400.71 TRINITY_DN48_c0_g2_i2:24-2057(+)